MIKYYTLRKNKDGIYWLEQEGYRLKNEYHLDLFIGKEKTITNKIMWTITEGKTGLKITSGRTRKEVIENLNNLLNKNNNLDKLYTQIPQFLNTYELSPLYNTNPKLPIKRKVN